MGLFLYIHVPVIEPPPEELEIDLVAGAQLMDPAEAEGKMKVLMARLEELEKAKKELEAAEKALKASLGQYGEELIEQFALDEEIGGDSDPGFDYGESFQLAQELVELGKEAVEPLLDALENLEDDFKTRRRSAKVLAMIKDKRALPTLIERFTSDYDPAYWGIMLAMNKMARDDPKNAKIVGTEMYRATKDPSKVTRMAKAWLDVSAAAVGGRKKYEKQIERFLLDGNKATRDAWFSMAPHYGKLNKNTQRTLAKLMLDDKDESTRSQAATAIAHSGFDVEVAGDLKRAFKNDSSARVRGAALGSLNSTALEDRVDINALATKDVAAPIRAAGAGGLSSGHGTHAISSAERKRAVAALRAVIRDKDPNVRMRAIGALGDLKSREAIPEVVRAIKSKDGRIRKSAMLSLQRIAGAVSLDDDTMDLLLEMAGGGNSRAMRMAGEYAPRNKAIATMTYLLKSENLRTRCIAMQILVSLKAKESADAIGKMIVHPHMSVRGRAIWAITQMGQRQYIPALVAQLHDKDVLKGTTIWATNSAIPMPKPFPSVYPEGYSAQAAVLGAMSWFNVTEAIPDLIQLVETHPHPGNRLSVARVLRNWARLDNRIVPVLIRFAEDVHPQTRLNVVDWLGRIGDKRAIPYLEKLMKGEHKTAAEAAPFALAPMEERTVWSACLSALVKLDDTSIIPYLKKELKKAGDDEGKKSQIVSSLRALGDSEGKKIARENYVRQLDHKDDAVKGNAALALANMRDKSVVPKLKTLAKSLPADMARLHVLQALTRLGHREGVGPLLAEIIANRKANEFARIGAVDFAPKIRAVECIPAMNDVIKDQAHYTMRYRTAWALVAMRDPRAIPGLIHKNLMKGPHAYGGWVVMRGLGNFKDKRAVRALIEFLEDKNDWVNMRGIAAESLGRIGDPEAIPVLVDQLRDEKMKGPAAVVRISSAKALGAIGTSAAVRPLIDVARGGGDIRVRRAVISALAKTKAPEALPALMAVMKDSSESVRSAAGASLSVDTGIDYKHFAAAVKTHPNNSSQIATVGKMVENARAAAPKIASLRKAIADNPNNLSTYLELAKLYEQLNMSGKAARTRRQYARIAAEEADSEIEAKVGGIVEGTLGDDGSWWLIGPFQWEGFATEYPPQLKIEKETYAGKGGNVVTWRKISLRPGVGGEISCEFGQFVTAAYTDSAFFIYRNMFS
ncbi:MAG: HEAT repeat domain-containing protein, partial [Phycisphaerae bacterium]|nr:HEAT repeat domain-containing protein [Phycisphaerae bacterium]